MSLFTTPKRVARNTLQHISRNPWHSLAAVLMMTLTFFVIQVFALVALGTNRIIEHFENKPQVTAFFKDSANEAYILQTKSQLEKTGLVKKVTYVSKQEALKIYRQQNQDEPELLEFVTADILPASLEVAPKSVDHLSQIAQRLRTDALVDKVIFQQDVVEALTSFTQKLRWVGVGLIGILSIITILLMVVVISTNIASFAKEIEVMRLVGAGSGFVRWPFVFDGIILGVLAASLASVGLWASLPYLQQFTASFITGVDVFPVVNQTLLQLWLGSLGAATLLGAVTSLVAVWRHVRV